MNNFIGVYENAFPNELCDYLIEHIDHVLEKSSHLGIINSKDTGREDTQFFLSESSLNDNTRFNEMLGSVCERYRNDYPVLQGIRLASLDNKLQKTKIGGGYHQWHFEQTNHDTSRRVIVWSVYLNDVKEGGETEFLYQHKRIKAKKGTAVFFPASYTHTHRGNPPLSNTKYIATGWYHVM